MSKLSIVDGITPKGHKFFEIVVNDYWKYPSLGFFKSRERAEKKIEEMQCQICGEYHEEGDVPHACETGDGE